MRKACDDSAAGLHEFNGESEHVHLLINYPSKMAVSGLVNRLTDVSARRLQPELTGRMNEAITRGSFWSPSYFAASCGAALLSSIRHHTEQQYHPA